MPIRLVLADSHPVFLSGLEQLLAAEKDFDVVECCGTAAQALAAMRRFKPDVLVSDTRLKGGDAFTLLGHLKAEHLPTRLVLLTQALNEEEALEALRAGVHGVVLKDMAPELVNRCIRKVHSGGKWMETQSFTRALDRVLQHESASQDLARTISPRELVVVRMIVAGLRNKDIARAMGIAEGTVKAHLHAIYQKLEVKGRMALAAYARRKGLT